MEARDEVKYMRAHQIYGKDKIHKQYIKHHGGSKGLGKQTGVAARLCFWVRLCTGLSPWPPGVLGQPIRTWGV